MAQDANVENLIINKLTRAQYESIANPDPTQLYFITDEVISSSDVTNALGYTPYNATNPDGFISSAAIASLTDVNLTGLADGQVLKYNSTTQKWENSAVGGGGTWGSITGTLSDQTDLQDALDAKQNTISDLSTIRSGASLGATALQPNDNISELTNDARYITSADLPTVNNGTLTIQKNGTTIGTFTANQNGNTTIDLDAGGGGGAVDQTYSPTSANAQSGVAINGAGFITSSALSGYVTSTEMTNGSISPVFDDTVTIGGRSIYYDSDDNIWYMGVEVNASAFSIADYKAYTETDAETGENSLFISSGITNDYIEFSSNGGVLYNGEEVATQTWVTNQGYTTNVGTVTSVNNTQPDANGNVTLTIPDTATWGNITGTLSDQTDLQTALDAKQNTISDLSTIRSGASLGATALQPNDNITELVNNAGYITGITSSDVTTALGYTPYNSTNPSGYITSSDLPTVDQTFDGTSQNAQSGVAIAGELNNYVPKEYLNTKIDISPSGLTISDTESQTKGSTLIISKAKGVSLGYIDETDMSNIIANTISANANGILLQSMNTNGLSAVTLTSVNNNLAINGTEVQEKLVSGTNIKTINNQSLLGNGNIDIQGGGGGVDVQAYTATEVETLWESI